MKKFFIAFLLLFSIVSYTFAQDRSDSIRICHYDISLSVTDFQNKIIDGIAELTIVSKINGLSHLDLDFILDADSVKLNGAALAFTQADALLCIPLPTPLNANDSTRLTIYYRDAVPTPASSFGGFYFVNGYAYAISCSIDETPHSYGRIWYPCLDLPNNKAAYDFHIETVAAKSAICGGHLQNVDTLDNGNTLWHWRLAAPVPTYLTSLAVGAYELYADTVHAINGILPLQIYVNPAVYDNVAASFAHWKEIFHAYENHYGAYPWEKIGYVSVEVLGGAMEHVMNIAYPRSSIDGTLQDESLYAHEMSHAWFGNLVTCQRVEEMWLNEGFATYSQAIFSGALYPNENPDEDGGRKEMRQILSTALKKLYCGDDGYYALDSVPQDHTYGYHSYEKGACVVHTLRHHIGDSLFFASLQQMLSHYAYQNIDSRTLFEELGQNSGIDLTPFYEGWVHQPGLPHFSIDSISPAGENKWKIHLRQRLSHARQFVNHNKIDITLFGHNDLQKTQTFEFSGEYGTAEMEFDEEPLFGILDFQEKMCDAVLDRNFTFNAPNSLQSDDADFAVLLSRIDGEKPLFMRIEENFVAPDGLKNPNPAITELSDQHYWRVVFDETRSADIAGKFSFRFTNDSPCKIDYDLIARHTLDSLILLYRANTADDWHIVPSVIVGGTNGLVRTTELHAGEYALGIGNPAAASITHATPASPLPFHITPTPAQDYIHIYCPEYQQIKEVILYDLQGREIKKIPLSNENTEVSTQGIAPGLYVCHGVTADNHYSQKILISK